MREIIEAEMPGCNVSLSCEIVPQIREYYRLSTTVINAYLQPILARYIANLDGRLSGAGVNTPQKYIMQSNGGMSTFAATAKKAVATVLSGPAGGITACIQTCRTTPYQNLITFDMGGTSCDVALIKDGEPSIANRGKIDGRDIALPMIEINTVSAGGGTLAHVDRFGSLIVGPRKRGRRARPRLLQPRRNAAHDHRLQRRARLSQPRQFSRRQDGARREGRARRRRDARRRAARHAASRKRPKASSPSST